MNDRQLLTIDDQANLDHHAELLRLGDALAAGRLSAMQPTPVKQLMDVASALAVALPHQSMAPIARDRLRQQLVADARRQNMDRGRLAPLAVRGMDLGRRSLTVLRRPEARRMVGASTAMIAALGVAILIHRRQGQRHAHTAALGLG